MPQMILDITPELQERMNGWSAQVKLPPEYLAIDLLNEYFEDCDDAEKLERLINSGEMETYPSEIVHRELEKRNAMDS